MRVSDSYQLNPAAVANIQRSRTGCENMEKLTKDEIIDLVKQITDVKIIQKLRSMNCF